MTDVFTYKNVEHSSQLPEIGIGKTAVSRARFWKGLIDQRVSDVPVSENPTYIATGGGYGAFDGLIDLLKEQGAIEKTIPSLRGNEFRNDPAFEREKPTVREAIKTHLDTLHGRPATDTEIEQIVTAFYNDEVNTKIVKGVLTADATPDPRFPKSAVLRCFEEKRSVIHESASIFPDTVQRADYAHANGVDCTLIAGTRDLENVMQDLPPNSTAYNTAMSYKRFSEQFQNVLIHKFDEIRLYDTDQAPPALIAEKKKGHALEIHDAERYDAFLKQKDIDADKYAAPIDTAHTVSDGHKRKDYRSIDHAQTKGKDRGD